MRLVRPISRCVIAVGLCMISAALGACEARRADPSPAAPATVAEGSSTEVVDPYTGFPDNLRRALLATQVEASEERLEAVRALGRFVDIRALPRLTEFLEDDDSRIRCQAADGIGQLGADGRGASAALTERLDSDGSAAVRQCAVLSLARVGGDQALERLLTYLTEAGSGETEDAIDALGRLGRIEAVSALVPHLESLDGTVVAATARAVARIGPGGAEQVRPYLGSERASTRCAAASILARLESADDVARLRRLSRYDTDPAVRICALGALGRLGDGEAVTALGELLGEGNRRQRARAAEALGVAATGQAVRTLIRALTTFHDDASPNPAQLALLAIGTPARTALEEALPSGPPLRRALVAETLGLLGDPAAAWSLERAALDTDPTVREAALAALEVLRSREQAEAHRPQR